MTPKKFRELALSLPEATESEHMNHPDFRVRGKIFATLSEDGSRGMVKLSPEVQAEFTSESPKAFAPANGAWGRNGATMVTLKHAKQADVFRGLVIAWQRTAPKALSVQFADKLEIE